MRIVELVGDRGDAEATVTATTTGLTRFANSFIHQNVAEVGFAVRLRVAREGRVASANSTTVTEKGLRTLVEDTLEIAALQPEDEGWTGLRTAVSVPTGESYDAATAAATPSDRADRVSDFVAAGQGMRAAGYCETTGVTTAFANTLGHVAKGRATWASVDGIHQSDAAAGSGHGTAVGLSGVDAAHVGATAAGRARRGAGAIDAKPGEYEVVLAPEAVASIVMFLSYYGFNGKAHNENRSFAIVGDDQFDSSVHIFDDGSDERAIGVPFDTEGTPKRRVVLIDDGLTANLVHDRRSAGRAGSESTGHASPRSEIYGPVAQDVFFRGGSVAPDDLVAGVSRGLYVATFNYCRVLDPKTLVVTGLTRNGTFLIENGSITDSVTNLRFTQSFVDALGPGNVLGIGDDARFADSEFGPAMMHVPSVRLAAWNFTGGASG